MHALDNLGFSQEIIMHDVYYAPHVSVNLLSVSQLNASNGFHVRFDIGNPHLCSQHTNTQIPLCPTNGIYEIEAHLCAKKFTGHSLAVFPASSSHSPLLCANLLHRRFAHCGHTRLRKLCKTIPGIKDAVRKALRSLPVCHTCADANATRQDSPPMSDRHLHHLDTTWSMDMFDMGADCLTVGGNRYATIVCILRTRYVMLFLHKTKDVAVSILNQAIAQAGCQPGRLRSDNAGEYESADFIAHCENLHIFRESSSADEQHGNGVAESLVNKVCRNMRALLLSSGLQNEFWGLALFYAIQIENHLPHSSTGFKIPIVEQFQRNYASWFRVFGCRATIHFDKECLEHHKLSPRGKADIFVGLGYTQGQKSWLVWLPELNHVVSSRNITFDENFHPCRAFDQRFAFEHSEQFLQPNITTSSQTNDNTDVTDIVPDDIGLTPNANDLARPPSPPPCVVDLIPSSFYIYFDYLVQIIIFQLVLIFQLVQIVT